MTESEQRSTFDKSTREAHAILLMLTGDGVTDASWEAAYKWRSRWERVTAADPATGR